jgi:hypothetical protein
MNGQEDELLAEIMEYEIPNEIDYDGRTGSGYKLCTKEGVLPFTCAFSLVLRNHSH